MSISIEIIFDNAGGITIQTGDFVHCYDDASAAARDVRALMSGSDPGDWDGNEPDCRLDPTDDEVRNGGYRVLTPDCFVGGKYADSSWRNVRDFQSAFIATE